VPFASDVSGFALAAFLDKAARGIASDRPDVVGNDSETDTVQPEFSEGVP
jgi:hypothetical protein